MISIFYFFGPSGSKILLYVDIIIAIKSENQLWDLGQLSTNDHNYLPLYD